MPAHLRPLVGKWTVMVSLETRDPDEARRLHPEAIREIEEWLATLEAGPKAPSEREAHDFASPVRDDGVALHRDNPSRTPWRTDLFVRLWRNIRAGLRGRPDLIHQVLHGESADRGEDGMEVLCFEQAGQLIEAKGLVVGKEGHRPLAKAVGASLQRASLTLERFALGDVADKAPPTTRPRPVASATAPKASPSKVAFDELVKGWATCTTWPADTVASTALRKQRDASWSEPCLGLARPTPYVNRPNASGH
ncbi:hypothetical protein FF100_05090 [Methylobacterium terricola]|uniref:DUF6538 domain-containing protein n=1 Tax=Methylobacterium terricola TaxID=2583531 RepID=A0A5C4LQ25_9HYPH|nr:DUF6538 domain-containing protein [Methylobacterium terricola]TNC14952.1 hypothetical protein FF100_05090 [Methylobacterium terricola]